MKMSSRKRSLGQGMTEYIIIVALIAIAAITVYTLFGKTIRGQVGGLAEELSGQDASATIGVAQGEATTAAAEGSVDKKMGTYNNTQ
ncbi:MAG: pilus assembly protein [Gammaproteobacteria bacterium]|nr:pilus assembly protein [Gammaproteobacteria bacterium]